MTQNNQTQPTNEKLESPPVGWVFESGDPDFYVRRGRAGDVNCAMVAATGHSERDACTILTNLDRLGWRLIQKESEHDRP